MGLQKNTAGQKWKVFAFNKTTNAPVTGDAANITAKIAKDWAAAAATDDVNPTEVEDGYYLFDLTQAESNANVLDLYPESSTADVQVIGVPGTIFTTVLQTGDSFGRLGSPIGASVSADLADVPTVAEFDARTLVAASYFDPAADTVALVTDVTTKTGYSLSTAGILAIWHQLTSAIVTAGTIGKLLKDNINATISSRMTEASINTTGGAVDTVTTVGTTTTNTDMVSEPPTAAAIVNEWETQSQADPTGFHVNLLEVAGTGQTGGDLKADLDTLLGRITSTLFANITSLAEWLGLIAGKQTGNATARTEIRATGAGSGTYDETADSGEAIRDRGDASWITGGGGGITDILNLQAVIPTSIDLANIATVRLGLMLTNALDDLPSTAEITPGTISIDRKAIGGTSWSAIVTDGACSEQAGLVYFDEVFDAGTGYAEGDSIRVTFKSQKITVAANDYEITDSNGVMFQTEVRQTMRGTNAALTDKAGFSLSTAGILAIWHQLTSAIVTANTIGKLLKDNIDGAISNIQSRLPAVLSGGLMKSDVLALDTQTGASTRLSRWLSAGHHGDAQAGTASTITLAAGADANDDFYLGCKVATSNGTGKKQYRLITAYNGTTKVATVTPDWIVNPDSSTEYVVIPSGMADMVAFVNDAQSALDLKDFADTGYDPGANKVQGVVLTDTATTLTNKTGFSLAATGLDLIVSTATGVVAMAKAVWDTVLTGMTFNITNSGGKRLRAIAGIILREGTAQAGSAITITLDAGASAVDNFYKHMSVRTVGGTGLQQQRIILSYVGATKVAIVSPQWSVSPDVTTQFEVVPGITHSAGTNIDLVIGHAVAATATTITLNGSASTKDNFYQNQLISIHDGIGKGQGRSVESYVGVTKVLTVHRAWDTTPDTTSEYVITAVVEVGPRGSSMTDLGGMSTAMKAEIKAEVDSAFTTQMTDSVSADGVISTREQALYIIQQMLTEFAAAGTTLTVKKVDGTTTLMTFTLNDAANPTSITRAT